MTKKRASLVCRHFVCVVEIVLGRLEALRSAVDWSASGDQLGGRPVKLRTKAQVWALRPQRGRQRRGRRNKAPVLQRAGAWREAQLLGSTEDALQAPQPQALQHVLEQL